MAVRKKGTARDDSAKLYGYSFWTDDQADMDTCNSHVLLRRPASVLSSRPCGPASKAGRSGAARGFLRFGGWRRNSASQNRLWSRPMTAWRRRARSTRGGALASSSRRRRSRWCLHGRQVSIQQSTSSPSSAVSSRPVRMCCNRLRAGCPKAGCRQRASKRLCATSRVRAVRRACAMIRPSASSRYEN